MSFIHDRVQLINGHLDQIQIRALERDTATSVSPFDSPLLDARASKFRALLNRTSTRLTARASAEPTCAVLAAVLHDARFLLENGPGPVVDATLTDSAHVRPGPALDELHWQLLSRLTTQTYGLFLDQLLRQAVRIESEIAYWHEVRASRRYTALYSIQTSPIRLWHWSGGIASEVRQRRNVLADSWRDFYDLVRHVAKARSIDSLKTRVLSPIALTRSQINVKRGNLRRLKADLANAIGYLMSNCLQDDNLTQSTSDPLRLDDAWKSIFSHALASMDAVLDSLLDPPNSVDDFDDTIHEAVQHDALGRISQSFIDARDDPRSGVVPCDSLAAADRLDYILTRKLPAWLNMSSRQLHMNQKPSFLVRYWLPITAMALSSSTILRLVANRKADAMQWIREFGGTALDFWYNWVIEPTRKIVATIHHDESNAVSLMSKRSLAGDQASLERMVVDFAIDNPGGPALSADDIARVHADIRQGDLTPVLLAYERELQKPLYSSIRGSLIRALLIQIQKTKVDVEIAMGGIDALLKSQELVFGFVGLTPGILICFGAYRWISSVSDSRSGTRRAKKQSQAYRIFRNIDRLLTASPQSDVGSLSSQDFGRLVCEAVVLRDTAARTFPRQTYDEFSSDLNDLLDRNSGVGRQIRVADRIRWAYSRWWA